MRSSSRRVVAVAEQIASRWPASLEPASLAGSTVLVAGLGRSGRSAALHLAGFGADVVACDDGEPERGELERAGVEVHTGGTPVELLEGRKLLVVARGRRRQRRPAADRRGAGPPAAGRAGGGAVQLPAPLHLDAAAGGRRLAEPGPRPPGLARQPGRLRGRRGAPRRCACPGATTWPTPWPPPAWRWRSAPTRPP